MFLTDFESMAILKQGQSRSINWENRKGEKAGRYGFRPFGPFPERISLYSADQSRRNGDTGRD